MRLDELKRLAIAWVPRQAAWWSIINQPAPSWGPAHELAHALISRPHQRSQNSYGLCDVGGCFCRGWSCLTYETAAMLLSSTWHRAVGYENLIVAEIDATPDYAVIDDAFWRIRGRRMLRRRGLWPIPTTVPEIRAACVRLIGESRG